jgi:hypothetical protein
MANTEAQALLQQLIDAQTRCFATAAVLTNADLDKRVPSGTREVLVRNTMYQLVAHPREHYVHLHKILQETGAPGAQPTEAQLIADQAAQALGTILGIFARITDDDLDREFEGHSPRNVLEHMIRAYQNYATVIESALPKPE